MCIEMRYLSRLGKLGFVYHLNHSKVKVCDSANFYNQTSNSHAAVFDKPTETSEGTACEARRTSPYCLSEASLRANVPSYLLRVASLVLRRGVAGVSGRNPEVVFLLQAFSFSNKKKMPKRGKCISFDYSRTRRQKPIINKPQLL